MNHNRPQSEIEIFSTIRLVPKCPNSSAPAKVSHVHFGTGAELSRPPETFFATVGSAEERFCRNTQKYADDD